ncbi:MAG TPA: C4-type zinc ribbon domain-containing protein [Ignavibacteria bacterium]|nr:C4-type zinc ribbon domain-containing protein [Ignavibacteria bacterium]
MTVNNIENEKPEEMNSEDNVEKESKVYEYFEAVDKSIKPRIEEELKILYELCKIDEDLKDIDDEKGDLPDRISEQKVTLDKIWEELDSKTAELAKLKDEEGSLRKTIKKGEDKIAKYDEQKYNAKSNKEYDTIMKSIDTQYETIEKGEKRLKDLSEIEEILSNEIQELRASSDEISADLKSNEDSLQELDEKYSQEELELKNKKEKLTVRLEDHIKKLYERINKTMKGSAVAVVRRGNCSGCFNSIPPQREIEIRSAAKLYTCQSCGRILVDEKLIG